MHRVFCPIESADGVFEELTPREHQVLYLVAAGARNQEVARHLQVSIKTVEFHLSNIRGKLGARSRTEAVMRACQVGILDVEAVMRSREMSLFDLDSPSRDAEARDRDLPRSRGTS